MWNKQLALNNVAGQTDAWPCGRQGRSVKPLGFYTATKTLSETRGIVCRCQKSSPLIIHHVLTLLRDCSAVMGHLSVAFSLNTLHYARHASLYGEADIWYKLSVFMEYWH